MCCVAVTPTRRWHLPSAWVAATGALHPPLQASRPSRPPLLSGLLHRRPAPAWRPQLQLPARQAPHTRVPPRLRAGRRQPSSRLPPCGVSRRPRGWQPRRQRPPLSSSRGGGKDRWAAKGDAERRRRQGVAARADAAKPQREAGERSAEVRESLVGAQPAAAEAAATPTAAEAADEPGRRELAQPAADLCQQGEQGEAAAQVAAAASSHAPQLAADASWWTLCLTACRGVPSTVRRTHIWSAPCTSGGPAAVCLPCRWARHRAGPSGSGGGWGRAHPAGAPRCW